MNKSPQTSPASYNKRTNQFLRLAARAARKWYDDEGKWLPATTPASTRERYWTCFALYANGMAALADAVIRVGVTDSSHIGKPRPTTFNIFHTNGACMLLVKHRSLMADDVKRKLEGLVNDGFAFQPGNRRPDYQFRGLNDNMPAKATMALILGGEMMGNDEVVQHGLWNLRQYRNMLTRRGTNSEYNSPTYSPLGIHAMGEIITYAQNAEARGIAAGIEERLWLDMAARFHPEMGVIAGPHSRAYTVDTLCHVSIMSALFWFVLGDIARPATIELFGEKNDLVLHHCGDLPFNIAQMCWFASGSYHLPARAKKLFKSKKYPFRAIATAEVDSGGPNVPAQTMRIESYLNRDYTVGTSSMNWVGCGESCYFVTYKKTPEVRTFRDIGTIFNKFAINGDVPGTIKIASDTKGTYTNSGEKDNMACRYNAITLQSDNTVMVAAHPSLDLAGVEGGHEAAPIERIDEMVVFPAHFGGAEEVRIGHRECKDWPGEAKHGEWIGFRRGRLLVAIRPLVYSKDPEGVRITLEKINNYEVIRSTFYHGTPKIFTRTELGTYFGGFMAEHASVDEYPTLEAFMEEVSKAAFTDYHLFTRLTRYRRPAGRVRPALEMEIAWSVGARVARFAIINGLPVPTDDPVQIDGLKKKDFPFLNQPWTSVPSYFPWKPLEAIENKRFGIVGDEER